MVSDGSTSIAYVIDERAGPPPTPAPGLPPFIHVRPEKVPFVHVMLGSTITLFNSPEDACVMAVASRDGTLGIEVHATFHPPGTRRSDVQEFITGR